jgi:hypothetical protein
MQPADRVLELYDRILASIGERAAEIEPCPLVSHWPHVGSAYRGLVKRIGSSSLRVRSSGSLPQMPLGSLV